MLETYLEPRWITEPIEPIQCGLAKLENQCNETNLKKANCPAPENFERQMIASAAASSLTVSACSTPSTKTYARSLECF